MMHIDVGFWSEDQGAVTVDWVVLTAALVGLGLATMAVVSSGVEDLSTDIEDQLATNTIIKVSFDFDARRDLVYETLFAHASATDDQGAYTMLDNQLVNHALNYGTLAQDAIAAGDQDDARRRLSQLAAITDVAADRNVTLDDATLSVDDLMADYQAEFES